MTCRLSGRQDGQILLYFADRDLDGFTSFRIGADVVGIVVKDDVVFGKTDVLGKLVGVVLKPEPRAVDVAVFGNLFLFPEFLLGHLPENIYNFDFSYRGGLEYDSAFVLGNGKDAFMVVGKQAEFQFVKLNQSALLASADEEEISDDDIDFDFL